MSFCSSFVALIAAMSVVTLPNAAVFGQDEYSDNPAEEDLTSSNGGKSNIFGQEHYSGCPAEEELSWSYGGRSNGPSKWGQSYSECLEEQQSPIDVDSINAVYNESLQMLQFSNYDKPANNSTLINRGHRIQLYINDDVKRSFAWQGGIYTLQYIDFRWGNDSHQGTEHSLDERKYALEVQLLHLKPPSFYSMVSVLFRKGDYSNSQLEVLTSYFKDIKYKGDRKTFTTSIDLSAMIPENPASYYSYNGSFTYPECVQGVTWFVLRKIMVTNEKQMRHFRENLYLVKEKDKDPRCKLVNNIRPVQPLNGRVVSLSD